MSTYPNYAEFLSSDGKHRIAVTFWEPEVPPIGVVQIVHGMREHMGRYQHFAQFLVDNGYIVYGHDHIGHGRTAMLWGMYGYFGKHKGARTLVSDSVSVTEFLHARYPDLPLFVLGHSMGSFIGRLQMLQVADLVDGFICMGTSSVTSVTPYARILTCGITKIKGGTASSRLANRAMDAISYGGVAGGEPVNSWISHDTRSVDEFTQDPHTNFTFTNQAYSDLLDLMMACNRPEWYQQLDRELPILLLSGGEDPIGEMGRDIEIIEKKLRDTGHKNISTKVYQGMRHEILNELNREQVYYQILVWFDTLRQQPIEPTLPLQD